MAESKPKPEPEVVDVDSLPTADTFDADDEDYDESAAPDELDDEAEAEYAEHERATQHDGGEEL